MLRLEARIQTKEGEQPRPEEVVPGARILLEEAVPDVWTSTLEVTLGDRRIGKFVIAEGAPAPSL